ncbi:MAG: Hpt domain-containing protein [Flavobacteriaceae bacterium]|nr:Hpt domain-containing protein [Flavobacteriaceae bacterium]
MIYNLDKINELSGGDQDFLVSVISTFLEEIPSDLEVLKNAVTAQDFTQIYQFAHKIKPNVDLLGMETARANALEIETLGKTTQDINKINQIFPALEKDVEQAVVELKAAFGL